MTSAGSAVMALASVCGCGVPVCGHDGGGRQNFFAINTVKLLFIHHHVHTLQHETDATIAKSAQLLRNLVHFQTDMDLLNKLKTGGAKIHLGGAV